MRIEFVDSAARESVLSHCGISVRLTPTGFETTGTVDRMPSPTIHPDSGHFHVEFERKTSASREARRALADKFRGKLSLAALSDAQLVVSELVTNAVEHGIGSTVSLDASIDDGVLTICVRSRSRIHDLTPSAEYELPAPDQRTGRGLPIMASLATAPPKIEATPSGAWHEYITVTVQLAV